VLAARYKLNLHIIQVGAECETTFLANIRPACTRLGSTTHKNPINKSLYMVKDYMVLLMESKCGTFIFQKPPSYRIRKFITHQNSPPATLTASQKNLYSSFYYIEQKSTVSQFAKETTRIHKMDVLI